MDVVTTLRTTPSTREFTAEPVSDDVVYQLLDDARFGPSGGNRQGWHVIVVRADDRKRRLAELYQLGMAEYQAHVAAGLVPFAGSEAPWRYPYQGAPQPAVDLEAARREAARHPRYLAEAPVLLVVTLDLSAVAAVDTGLGRLSVAAGASVYPFVHNILLGARARGLGGHITTVLARQEPAVRELLALPHDQVLASLVPLGHPAKEVTRLRRRPVEAFATVETADGPPLGAGG